MELWLLDLLELDSELLLRLEELSELLDLEELLLLELSEELLQLELELLQIVCTSVGAGAAPSGATCQPVSGG